MTMAWVAIGATVVSAGVSLYSANKSAQTQAKASQKASDTTLTATRETNALKKEMFDSNRADMKPWLEAGKKALARVEATPDFSFSNEQFFKDPSFQFRMDEGNKAIEASASARGNVLSGSQQKALLQYSQNLASTEYGNAFNRAKSTYTTNLNKDQSLSGIGQQTANQVGQAGSNMANSVGSTTMQGTAQSNAFLQQGANAKAQGYRDMATISNKFIGNALVAYQGGS